MNMRRNTCTQACLQAVQGVGLLVTLLIAAALVGGVVPALARAGTWMEDSCRNPNGSAAPNENWSSFAEGSPGYGSTTSVDCAPMFGLLSRDAPAGVDDSEDIEYSPPAGSRLIGGEADVSMEANGGGYNASGVAAAYTPALAYNGSNLFFQCASGLAPCANGTNDFYGVLALPADRGGDFFLGAGCGGEQGAVCNSGGSNGAWALVDLWWAYFLLENDASPGGSSISGPLLNGDVSGTQSVSMLASDPGGPGVYRVIVSSEGTMLYEASPDQNGGHCVPDGSSGGVLMFDYSQPCKSSESVTISVPTVALHDGKHDLSIVVEDAAGNRSTVYNGTIETSNAPVVNTAPAISGRAATGSTLTAIPATFTAPEGAGVLSAISGQWLRCTDAEATRCASIPGATSSTYAPTSSDVNYYLVYRSTAADSDGSTSSDSVPTLAVSEPTKEAASSGGQSTGGNGGIGGTGGPGGSGSGGASGGNGAGSGVTVNLDTTGRPLGSTAPWQVTLKVSRHRVHRGTTIKLKGVVPTTPRPARGKLVWLRARSVEAERKGGPRHRHRVTVYHKWITFAVLRTRGSGAFKTTHRFRIGGHHVYEFQAIAPQESGYLNHTGSSRVATVTERPAHGKGEEAR
jgi:hypothetical protein